jgi:outer membrane receptor protein involved in Fe transport
MRLPLLPQIARRPQVAAVPSCLPLIRATTTWLPGVAGALLALLPTMHYGQTKAPDNPAPSEPVLVLSPFVVQSSSDVGYQASESLAGTGLKSKLTDLGASVSVVTSKLMEDTGSKNLGDILVYQTNMEVRGFGGNLSGANPSLGGVTGEPSLGNGPTGTRVRGLAEATQARNFYRSIIPMDGYNTDRLEINRGANALLFGVGSPAGIINTSTTAAELHKSSGKVELAGGSYGSWRSSFDFNLAPKRGELAVRVAAVRDEEKYQQDFAFTDTERYYAAAAWDIKALRNRGILTSTTLRASYENGDITSNNPRVLPPNDRYSSWFDATLPASLKALGAVGKVTYNPTTAPFGIFNSASRNATIGTANEVNRGPTFVFQDVNATAPRDNIQAGAGGAAVLGRVFVTSNVFFPSTGQTGTAQAAYSREMSRVRQDYAFPDQAFYTAENMTDPTVFNFFDNLLAGPNARAASHLEAADISLQQLLLEQKLGFEVSFNRQRWRESLQSLFSESAPYISIDVNTRMWSGEANPNLGRPFISTAGNTSYNQQEIETSRAKLFYELDLEDKLKGRLGGILGKHVFSLLAQREILSTDTRTGGRLFYTPDLWVNGNSQSRNTFTGKTPAVWVYLGPSLIDAATPSGANISGLQQNLMDFQNEVNGKGVLLTRVPAPTAAVAAQATYNPFYTTINLQKEDEKVSNTAAAAALNERTLDSQAFALQSNWLQDHLVSTIGWRKEESSIRGINAPIVTNGEGYALVGDPLYSLSNPAIAPQVFSKTLFAWSGVAKAPAAWLRRVPGLTALNLFYGNSENFNPSSGRSVDAFGVSLAPPSGVTKEQGAYLEALDGRITARLNFFETTQTGSFNSAVGNLAAQVVSIHSQTYTAVQNGWVANAGNGFPAGYVPPPQALLDLFNWKVQNGTTSSSNPGVSDTSDFVTKGKELEIMIRPTRGLSFVLNVSEQKSVRSNTGNATRKLLFDTPTASGKPLATEWLSDWTYFIPLSQAAIPRIGDRTEPNMMGSTFQRTVLNVFNTAASADGAPVQELRRWRANLVANYDFQAGRLKGFGVGTGVRWLDKSAIGYPVATFEADLSPSDGIAEASDIRISDVRNPYFGPAETNFDGWLSYQTKILRGRVGLKIQLNVRNIGVHDKLVPVVINPDGTIPVWSIAEGQKFTLSTKFTF